MPSSERRARATASSGPRHSWSSRRPCGPQAAEGALLAEDAVSGKATSNYVHEHAVELSEAASQIEATLRAGSTDPSLEPERGQLVVLARRISDDLLRLSEASTDEQRTLTSELQAAADASQRIGDGLT